ncbi:MAG: DM13 domain-containing protein [Candidatus Thorarchaeota archaeon]
MLRISRPLVAVLGISIIIIAAFSLWWFSPVLFPVDDTEPEEETNFTVLLSGVLQEVDSVHKGSGTVQLVESNLGHQSIRFIDVSITDGPDLYVYLSKQSSFSGIYDGPGEYVSLGRTLTVTGNFTASIPDSVDGTEYTSVLIWCQAFSVLFTYAVLE